MKRYLLVLLLLANSYASAQVVGRVLYVNDSTKATVMKPNRQVFALTKGASIETSDVIRTSEGGYAQLTLIDKGEVTLREKSALRIAAYTYEGKGKDSSVLDFLSGSFRAITGMIGSNNKRDYAIRTPTATIGIRGTDGNIGVSAAGTWVQTLRGGYIINANGKMLDVAPGRVGFAGVSAPQYVKNFPFGTHNETVVEAVPVADNDTAVGPTEKPKEQKKEAKSGKEALSDKEDQVTGVYNGAKVGVEAVGQKGFGLVSRNAAGLYLGQAEQQLFLTSNSENDVQGGAIRGAAIQVDPNGVLTGLQAGARGNQDPVNIIWNGYALTDQLNVDGGIQLRRMANTNGYIERSTSHALNGKPIVWQYAPASGLAIPLTGTYNYTIDTALSKVSDGQGGNLTVGGNAALYLSLSAHYGTLNYDLLKDGTTDSWAVNSSFLLDANGHFVGGTGLSNAQAEYKRNGGQQIYSSGSQTSFEGTVTGTSNELGLITVAGQIINPNVLERFNGTLVFKNGNTGGTATNLYTVVLKGADSFGGPVVINNATLNADANGALKSFTYTDPKTGLTRTIAFQGGTSTLSSVDSTIFTGTWGNPQDGSLGVVQDKQSGNPHAAYTWATLPTSRNFMYAPTISGTRTYTSTGAILRNSAEQAMSVTTANLAVDFTNHRVNSTVAGQVTGGTETWSWVGNQMPLLQDGSFAAKKNPDLQNGTLTLTHNGVTQPAQNGGMQGRLGGDTLNTSVVNVTATAGAGQGANGVVAFKTVTDNTTPEAVMPVAAAYSRLGNNSTATTTLSRESNSTHLSNTLTQFELYGDANARFTTDVAATVSQAGSSSGLIWGRWDAPFAATSQSSGTVIQGNNNLHYVAYTGGSTSTMPVSGVFQYNAVGGTNPVDNLGASGSVVGCLTADFNTRTAVYDAAITMPTYSANLATGAMPIQSGGSFVSAPATLTATLTQNGVTTQAQGQVNGFFAGSNAAVGGVSYTVSGRLNNAPINVNGAQGFVRP